MSIWLSLGRTLKSVRAPGIVRDLLFALGALTLLLAVFGYRRRQQSVGVAEQEPPRMAPASPVPRNGISPPFGEAKQPHSLPVDAVAVYTALGAVCSLALSLESVNRPNGTTVSLLGWLAAMALAVLSASRIDSRPARSASEAVPPRRQYVARVRSGLVNWEFLAFLVIFLVGAAARLYDLAGYPSGVHGDETGFGLVAVSILKGNGPNPFGTAFLDDPALYLYIEAPFIAIFGQTIPAIRLLAGIAGTLGLAAFYVLIRKQFGTRPALIALMLLAGNGAAVNFSRLALNVAEVPLFMSLTFLAFWVAQQGRRPVWWLLTGLVGGLGIYFHFDDRLVPIILGLFFLYLFVADHARWLDWLKGAGLTLLGSAIALSPLVVNELNQLYHLTGHMTGRLVTNNLGRATVAYHTSSLPQILVGQVVVNIQAFYQGVDASQFYTFAGMPVLVPLLGPLFLLGLIFTLARITDRRYAFLTIWFWVILIVGGAMTIDSPQDHRLYPAVLPAFAGMALLLDWAIGRLASLEPQYGAQVATVIAFLVPVVAGYSDLANYFGPAAANRPWEVGTTQGTYLAGLGSGYRAYTLGTPMIYFDFSVSQYLAPMVEGDSLQNPAVDLPKAVPADKNLAFLVYAPMAQYLPLVESTYPGGEVEVIKDHTGGTLFTAYLVPKEAVARQQGLLARYGDAGAVEHQLGSLGGGARVYPSAATWSGSIFSEQPGSYAFRVAGGEAEVVVNGTTLGPDGKITLPEGWNNLLIKATLPSPGTRLSLEWQPPGEKMQIVDPRWVDSRSLGGALQARITAGDGAVVERTDRTVGFRVLSQVVQMPGASSVVWSGSLLVPRPGAFKIGLSSSSAASVLLDGQTIVSSANGTGDTPSVASVNLDNRPHALEVRYAWPVGSQPLQIEITWQPPDGSPVIVPPEDLGPP